MSCMAEWAGLRVTPDLAKAANDFVKNNKKFKGMGINNASQLAAYLIRREIDRYCKH